MSILGTPTLYRLWLSSGISYFMDDADIII
jgi:hypothetical protein